MRIAIIGCGNMGTAIAQRLSSSQSLFLYDHNEDKAKKLEAEGYGKAAKTLQEAIESSDILILAIKPQSLKAAAPSIDKLIKNNQLLISILSGTQLTTLHQFFPKARVVRMMPNLAVAIGQGALALTASIEEQVRQPLNEIFAPLGKVYWIPESKMDAFTALAGSGPAFAFVLIEAMVEAGIALGFSAGESQDIICQMLQGSLALLQKTKKHPAELKWQITSPGGTTIAGLRSLEEHVVRSGLIDAFIKTYERSKQLAEE